MVYDVPGLAVRHITSYFHAKIYIFDNIAFLGSSNLANGGLYWNHELLICLQREEDRNAVENIRTLFQQLWDIGLDLNKEKLERYTVTHTYARRDGLDLGDRPCQRKSD